MALLGLQQQAGETRMRALASWFHRAHKVLEKRQSFGASTKAHIKPQDDLRGNFPEISNIVPVSTGSVL